MGGHAGGEIAAQIAVRLFIERFQQEATPILKNPLTFLHETMVKAHTALGSYSAQFSMLETPRTTVRRVHRASGTRVLGARRRFAALLVQARRADCVHA
jgi:serine/threonine protein phosphatase PrpC